MLVFDPVQIKTFGHEYYETDTFSVRYVLSKKLIFKSIYIPYGPVIKSENGFNDFFEYLKREKFNKVKIDLPKIYSEELKEKFKLMLRDNGFKESKYLQDQETIKLNVSNSGLKLRYQNLNKKLLEEFEVKIFNDLNESVIDEKTRLPLTKVIYEIYSKSGHEAHYNVKPYEAILDVFKNSVTSVAYLKTTREVCGFVLGYKVNNQVIDNFNSKELLILFTALNTIGRESKIGYLIHDNLFRYVFNDLGYSTIDFHGCDRSKGRSYVEFKERFGGEYVSYPGSFTKTNYFNF